MGLRDLELREFIYSRSDGTEINLRFMWLQVAKATPLPQISPSLSSEGYPLSTPNYPFLLCKLILIFLKSLTSLAIFSLFYFFFLIYFVMSLIPSTSPLISYSSIIIIMLLLISSVTPSIYSRYALIHSKAFHINQLTPLHCTSTHFLVPYFYLSAAQDTSHLPHINVHLLIVTSSTS